MENNENNGYGYFAFLIPELNNCGKETEKFFQLKLWIEKNVGAEFMASLAYRLKDKKPEKLVTINWEMRITDKPHSAS